MVDRDKDGEKTIKIRRPKQRVRVSIKTGTVVHKSRKSYSRKIKHKERPTEADDADDK